MSWWCCGYCEPLRRVGRRQDLELVGSLEVAGEHLHAKLAKLKRSLHALTDADLPAVAGVLAIAAVGAQMRRRDPHWLAAERRAAWRGELARRTSYTHAKPSRSPSVTQPCEARMCISRPVGGTVAPFGATTYLVPKGPSRTARRSVER